MPTIGKAVAEIRVRIGQKFRVLYVSTFAEATYVLHAFEKKSQKTAQRDLEVATERLGQLLRTRGGR
jgi:phage-related protein